MKSRLIYFLTLLFIVTSIPIMADEYHPEPSSRQKKSYRKRRAGRKVKRKRRLSSRRYKVKRRVAARRTVRPARKRLAHARTSTPPKKKTVAAVTPPPRASEPAPVTMRPVQPAVTLRSDRRIADSWRGLVKRSIAQTETGGIAPVEHFATLSALLRTLPEDGEVRVRYGIYQGVRNKAFDERIDVERRNVSVPCWLYAVRFDTSDGATARDIQLLVGTSNDTARARYMIAEVPEPLANAPDAALFGQTRDQLLTLLSGYEIGTSFRRMTPRQVVVEGSLFFDGINSVTEADDPSGEALLPSTVWQIRPVTSVTAAATTD